MDAASALAATNRTWTQCPVCGSAEARPFAVFEELSFVRCAGCTTVYKQMERPDLRPREFYERGYFQGRKSGREKRFEHRVHKAMRWVDSIRDLGEVHSLLDVGCSLGYVVEGGKRLGLDAAGSDISQYAVDVCRERGLRAEVGTLEAQPFPDGAFDLITMKHVIEHTGSPAVALKEVRRLLSPRGLVLIAVPNLTYWKGLFRRRSYRYFRPDDLGQQHYVYYTRATMRRLLERNGFEVLVTSKAFFRPKHAARSLGHRLAEGVRWAALTAGYGLAAALLQQREVFVVARKALPVVPRAA